MLKSWKDVKNNKDDFVSLDEMYDDNNKLISEFHIFLYGYFGKITSLKLIDLEALKYTFTK